VNYMPRLPRNRSKSGIYHIVMRGTNRQTIFEDTEDYEKFIQTIQRYKPVCEYELFAYCLMGNHLHILLKEGKELLDQVMRRICGSYVYWYNRKYERIGNLFQGRYASEPVEEEAYFLTAMRYIYQNPVKAGLVKNVREYTWSNYGEYINRNIMTDADFALDMLNRDREIAIKNFTTYINKFNDDTCLDIEEKKRLTDKDAKVIITNLCKIEHATDMQKLDIRIRNQYLKELKEGHDLSIRQIERLTGINRGVVSKA
jgi:putative transposase